MVLDASIDMSTNEQWTPAQMNGPTNVQITSYYRLVPEIRLTDLKVKDNLRQFKKL